MIKDHKITCILSAFFFVGAYHWLYFHYIFPVFSYANYNYNDRTNLQYLFSYICAIAPIFASSSRPTPANYGTALIYVFCYAPSQLTIAFMWSQSDISLLIIQTTLALSMSALFFVATYKLTFSYNKIKEKGSIELSKKTVFLISCLTLLSLVALILENRQHMRLVGFDEVYDLRFDAADAQISTLSGYLTLWLTTCFIPYYAAIGVIKKSIFNCLVASLIGFLVYMSNGAKIALLMPYAIMFICYMYSEKGNFLSRLLLFSSFMLCSLASINGLVADLLKSLVVMRTLSTGGWTITVYYDYFVTHGVTYYSHIRPIMALLGNYPYGELSLGQVIGLEYSGSADANFNANFWASDGIAALGILGIIPVTIAVATILLIINSSVGACNRKLLTVWMTGFWVALLNTPLMTSIVSGGGLLVLLLIWHSSFFQFRRR